MVGEVAGMALGVDNEGFMQMVVAAMA